MPTRLRNLVEQAKRAMQNRNHNPGPVQYALIKDHDGQPIGARIRCTGCDLAGFVTVWPKGNEIDIGGPAIGLNCATFNGTVSEGTTNPVYLIRAFIPRAEKLFKGEDRVEVYQIRLRSQKGYHNLFSSPEPQEWIDKVNEDLDFLIDGLNTCAPKGMYFGAHPNDGADFGFWQVPS